MIILTQNRKLQIDSSIADLEWTVSWQKVTVTCGINCEPCLEDNEAQGNTVVGEVDIVPLTTTNTNNKTYSNRIEYISVYNSTFSNADITIQIENSGTPKTIFKITLQPAYNLIYNEDSGWDTYSSTGGTPTPPTFDDMTYYPITGADTYTGTIPGLVSYTQILNKSVGIIPDAANGGPATVDFGFGALTMLKFGDQALQANDFKANQGFIGFYDGTDFQIVTITDNIAVGP